MIDVRYVRLDQTKRMIVISDIHANVNLFKKLLEKLHYTEDDYLFINGDLCEKGADSLEVVKYVKGLSKKPNVYVTKGNCDLLHRYVLNDNKEIISYMKKQKNSILNEMLSVFGKSLDDFPRFEDVAGHYREYFQDEIDWIESFPIAYETDEFIIIHSGIENIENWRQTDESIALYGQAFYEKEHQADKIVIVGHWPVVNYRAEQVTSNNPIIDLDKKIIALDGGNQIKVDGQLNALIIENGTYSFTYVDELTEEMIVQKDYIDKTGRIGTVTYPNYDLQIIKQEEYFTLCKNSKLGNQQWIKNEYLIDEAEQTRCKDDLSTSFLSVKEGEKVSVVNNECAGYSLIKKANGEVGWVPKDCFDLQ
ncbi:metallophosphoesterase [Heyndrickxia sp. NPDC080065]|uniref:metallophosphoesterase n=1 Tax=Heyndrickxia sp. NPDC080065 TaxID=3390568 RepID=UPI003D0561B2